MNDTILSVEGVSKRFDGRRPTEVLRDVTLRLDVGEFVSIVGPSGSGKSTLFNLVAGIEAPDRGSIAVRGETDAERRRLQTGYMFQKDLLFPWRNTLDNAALGLEVAGGSRDAARVKARALMARFGLEGFEMHRPAQLSGGMRQRVALLRTLLLERPLLLLDEPFASLDALTRRELQAWLRETWRAGSEAALLVTHDVHEAVYLSDRVYVMGPRPGHIVAEIATPKLADDDPTALATHEAAVLAALKAEAVLV